VSHSAVTIDTCCNVNKEISIKICFVYMCVSIYICTHCNEASYLCVFVQAGCCYKFM
jgi:hypothetical protein